MGIYLNPGNKGFQEILQSEYVDKTGLNGMDFEAVRQMCAMREQKCRSYWQKTSAAESLVAYINMDFDGLQEIISRLISGEEIEVDTDLFENDFETFKSRDDVLTLLIHLGYLAWNVPKSFWRTP